MGHLEWHLRLRADPVPLDAGYSWCPSRLSATNQLAVATRIEAILERNVGKIPYSIAHEGPTFSDDVWVGNEPGQGLTCATFVKTIFENAALPLVDFSTWLDRQDDPEWKQRLIGWMRGCDDIPEDHIAAQVERMGSTIRFRPEDAAAACDLRELGPMSFADVDPPARALQQRLSAVEAPGMVTDS